MFDINDIGINFWANIGPTINNNLPMFSQLYNIAPISIQERFAAWEWLENG